MIMVSSIIPFLLCFYVRIWHPLYTTQRPKKPSFWVDIMIKDIQMLIQNAQRSTLITPPRPHHHPKLSTLSATGEQWLPLSQHCSIAKAINRLFLRLSSMLQSYFCCCMCVDCHGLTALVLYILLAWTTDC